MMAVPGRRTGLNGALTPATVSRSAATLWVGVMARFFYAFSAVVMPRVVFS